MFGWLLPDTAILAFLAFADNRIFDCGSKNHLASGCLAAAGEKPQPFSHPLVMEGAEPAHIGDDAHHDDQAEAKSDVQMRHLRLGPPGDEAHDQ